jgi:CubicO group peptidase (beta-lactamase class C family)
MKKTLLVAVLTILMGQAFSQQNQFKNRMEEVENNLIPYVPVKGFEGWKIEERMRYYHVPGVSIAVIKDYRIDWAKGYGLADTLKKISVTTETMFSAGSISKFVAAVTALNLVQQGKLSLDEPINNYLRSWKIAENELTKKTPITLRMLLSHTAGTTQSAYFGFTPDKSPLPSIVDILNGTPSSESRPVVVNSEPNKEFRYSGGGSIIAQLAMMDVSGQSFSDLTKRKIFDPLGMKHTTFEQPLPEKYSVNASWAYSSAPWFKGMPYVYPQQAAAGLYTTPSDLAEFFVDVQKSYIGKGKILDQTIARQMLTPQVTVSSGGYREDMGIGPFLLQRIDNTETQGVYFEFTGVNAGFLAYGIASLTEGNGVIIMMNSGDDVNGLGKEIRRAVAKAYNWYKFLPEEVQPIKVPDKTLDSYVGRYRKAVDEVVYIKKEKDYLVETINEGNAIYCFPIKEDTIVFTDFNVKGWFAKDENGNVISLKTEWQNEPMKKMRSDEFTPSEYLKITKYKEAKDGFRQMNMNEYQLTYLAYNLLNQKNADPRAVLAVLELGLEQHPNSSIVHARLGDYYVFIKDRENAVRSFRKALELDGSDDSTKEKLNGLINKEK